MQRTELSTLGKVAFIERLTAPFSSTVISGVGDDCAVVERGDNSGLEILSKKLMLEGIHFDLSYTPLEHLGWKLVTAGVSSCVAMNGVARYVMIGVGLSGRFCVEEAEALYSGVERACGEYGVELIGGDTSASMTGLTLSITTIGEVDKERLTLRSGASSDELLCCTGSLGAAYLGLKLLEREKRVDGGEGNILQKIFEENKYVLGKQLQPFAKTNTVELLREVDIVPTSMIDITSGLASAVLSLSKASGLGARLHLSKIPVNGKVSELSEEFNLDPIIAILNGGDDFELLFTLPVTLHEKVKELGDVNIIGFMTAQQEGCALVTPDNQAISITSPDFTATVKQQ